MISNIALKELFVSMTSVRFIITVLVCCLLMPLSTWVLSSDYTKDYEDYRERVELESRRDSTSKQFVTIASRPVPQLSSLFNGINNSAVNTINLKYFIGWNVPISAGRQSVTNSIFPTVDITFIVGIVLSALALMLSFDAISGEKYQATLRLMMSNSLSRASIVIGKWLGLTLAILIPYLLGLVLSLLIFFFITGISLSTANAISLVLAIVVTMIYLSLFILIGITVSAFTKSPALSILVSLGVWGVLIFVVPQIANAISTQLNETSTPQLVEREIRIAYNEMAEGIRQKNIAITDKAKAENIPYSEFNPERFATDMQMAEENRVRANQIEMEYWNTVTRQENTARILSLASPFSALKQSLMSLAETGPEAQRAFLQQAYEYGERYFVSIWGMATGDQDYTWDEIISGQPEFKMTNHSVDQRLELALLPIAAMILLMVVLAMVTVISFNRYDVR